MVIWQAEVVILSYSRDIMGSIYQDFREMTFYPEKQEWASYSRIRSCFDTEKLRSEWEIRVIPLSCIHGKGWEWLIATTVKCHSKADSKPCFQPLTFSAKAPCWMFNMVLNTLLAFDTVEGIALPTGSFSILRM